MLELRIALRYLVAKKSANAINIITAITMLGVIVGSAAFILILSGLNGFETLIGDRFGLFNPDLKIEARQGKVFVADSALLARVQAVPGVEAVSCALEEVALFAFDDAQSLGILKGVDSAFAAVSDLDSVTVASGDGGRFELGSPDLYFAVAGAGIANKLGLIYDNRARGGGEPLRVYMAKRGNVGGGGLMGGQPFKSRALHLGGTFEILQDFNNHVFVDLEFSRELLSYSGQEASALELKLSPGASIRQVEQALQQALGEGFSVKDRFAQDETFYKITNMERWAVFAILCLAYAIVAFNMIGALWMLVLEKRRDVAMLVAMGATQGFVRRIFLLEGALISLLGCGIGFVVATALVWAQQTFHLIGMEGNLIIQYYPMNLRAGDFVLVACTVLGIGLLAAWLPATRAAKTDGLGALVNAN